jgi:hypothetical protein
MDGSLSGQWPGLRLNINTDRRRLFSGIVSYLHDHSATAPVLELRPAALR